jgi:hypothetical protein
VVVTKRNSRYEAVLVLLKPRKARCGACGHVKEVDAYMRRYPRTNQYVRRRSQQYDEYYCGCEDHVDDIGTWFDPWY